jgi:phosphoribosylformylglycinamidine cyclo-ligase
MESSGLHSNGYSLVRRIVEDRGFKYTEHSPEFEGTLGEALLTPTRLYTGVLNELLGSELGSAVHSMSHITGGGIAANLARVLPKGLSLSVDRSTWTPLPVFQVLSPWGGFSLESVEGTWNLGLGQALVVSAEQAERVSSMLNARGYKTWTLGEIESQPENLSEYVQGAKGVDGGAVKLFGSFAS